MAGSPQLKMHIQVLPVWMLKSLFAGLWYALGQPLLDFRVIDRLVGRVPFALYVSTEYAWEYYEEAEGKLTINVLKELLRRSLDVACARAGLEWCENRRVFCFAPTDGRNRNMSFEHVDGRHTHVAVTGERQLGWGERASRFRYQLAPIFRPGRDEAGDWWVTMRLYLKLSLEKRLQSRKHMNQIWSLTGHSRRRAIA